MVGVGTHEELLEDQRDLSGDRRVAAGGGGMSTPDTLTEEERLELELAEQARQNSGDWDSVKPGKAGELRQELRPADRPSAAARGGVHLRLDPRRRSASCSRSSPRSCSARRRTSSSRASSRTPSPRSSPPAPRRSRSSRHCAAPARPTSRTWSRAMNDFAVGAGVDFEALRMVIVAVLAIYVVSSFLSWIQGYVINIIMVRTMWRLRESVEVKINRLPLSYFDKVQRGELISRVTNDIDNITQTMQQSLSTRRDVRAHGDRRADHDVLDLVAARARRAGVAAAHGGDLRRDRPAVAEGLRHPVAQGRPPQRPRRGVVLRSRARQGLRPRGSTRARSSRSRTRSSTKPASRRSSSPASSCPA